MSHTLISRNADLQRLVDEGYALSIRSGFLVVEDVWYLDARANVRKGALVSVLELSGNRTNKPEDHKMFFVGGVPHHKDGKPINGILHNSNAKVLAPGLEIHCEFSNKPSGGGYKNYYEKVKRYADIINGEARAVDQQMYDARTFRVIASPDQRHPFEYLDTASTRAGMASDVAAFESQRIAIVGLGGTGAYTLDLASKTPVLEIHMYDGDRFHQHNAFRSPGAAAIDTWPEGQSSPLKVEYYAALYSAMKRGLIPHPYRITAENVHELLQFDFVFVCVDHGPTRKLIIETLISKGRKFIDVGINVRRTHDQRQLLGTCRVTSGSPDQYDHVGSHIPMSDEEIENVYTDNVQIAELNSANAAFAVIRWKVMSGFYADERFSVSSSFSTNFNAIMNTTVEQ